MQHKVYILTGVIQTGKTTSLMQWCESKEHVQGILTPVIDGKRMFKDIAAKEMFAMEAGERETNVLKVGRFIFSVPAFSKAEQIINGSTNYSYLIIDEVGPLELRREGLFAAVHQALQNQTSPIILVVREGLVDKTTAFFNIKDPIIITKTALGLL